MRHISLQKETPFEVVGPSNIRSLIVWVTGILRRTVVSDLRLDNLRGSHPKSQVIEEVVQTSVAKNNFLRTPVTKIIISIKVCYSWVQTILL